MAIIINALALLLLAILLAGIMIPQILLISFRKKLFDNPDERKIHTLPVPRLGGIAFLPVILISIAFVMGINLLCGYTVLFNSFSYNHLAILFSFCALMTLFVVGLADDLIGVRYRAKFVVQVGCAVLLICGGLVVDNFHGFLGLFQINTVFSWFFSIILAVFIINALNLIDGIDGLASGLSSVAVIIYGVAFYILGDYLYMMLSITTLGVLIPFFYFNVFGKAEKKQKIFMGDTGSLTIGLINVILSFRLLTIQSSPAIGNINLLVVAMSPLLLPCFDVVRVFIYRIRNHKDPFLPDKNHLHHRLLELGLNQSLVMIFIVTSSIIFTTVNILLSSCLDVNFIILLDAFLFGLAMAIIPRFIRKHKEKMGVSKTSSISQK